MNVEWKYRETRDAEYARCKVYPFFVTAMDCDGDMSEWWIKRHDKIVIQGNSASQNPYHFDVAKADALTALDELVSQRIEDLEKELARLRSKMAATTPD